VSAFSRDGTSFDAFGETAMTLAASVWLATSVANTPLIDPHKGSVFLAGRIIVLAVPIIIVTLIYLRIKGPKK
jgi:hypothetical protein